METQTHDDATLWCDACGYDLTGLKKCRCPECGAVYVMEKLRVLNDWKRVKLKRVIGRLTITPLITCLFFMMVCIKDPKGAEIGALFLLVVGFCINLAVNIDAADRLSQYLANRAAGGIAVTYSALKFLLVLSTLMFLTNGTMFLGVLVIGYLFSL